MSVTLDDETPRLGATSRGTALRLAIVGNVVPVGLATAVDFGDHRPVFFLGGAFACVAAVVVTATSRRHPVPFYAAAYGGIPALTALQAYSGGVASGYAVLLMMAMVWFGLQSTDRELLVALGVLSACAYGPMLVVGAPAYPVSFGHATLLVLIGATVAGSLRFAVREAQRLHRRTRKLALGDELTGLLNRRGWTQESARILARAAREGTPVALVTLDLDGLKRVNDTSGHDEGDRLLAATAMRLRQALREGDSLARLGGDEFAALLPNTTLEAAVAAADRLGEQTPPVGRFSCGVAAWDGRESVEELMRRSDLALYEVKTAGGGRSAIAPASALAEGFASPA